VIRQHAPRAQDFVNRRYRNRGVVDEVERMKNRTKSKVRANVEHSIGIIKRVFGFAKVRYRGLEKNAHRLIATCALANHGASGSIVLLECLHCSSTAETTKAAPDGAFAPVDEISMPLSNAATPCSDVP
jgi:hypothetical protein